MEWREQTAPGCEEAFSEAQRWMEEVTKKRFGSNNFRSALENGVLLCDLINKLNPGIIKRVNRLSTPIAGLDNVNVFLKACGKLGLNDAQLFHPGDLQDVSTRVTVRHQETSRRLKNVLITIYWLGRKAQADPSYTGPQLNFKAFEGLLGVALSKALEEASCSRSSVRDSGFSETWYPDREVPSYRREDSVESLDSVESHTLSAASDCTLIAGSEAFGSDAEAEHCFRMTETPSAPGRERQTLPAVLRRKRSEQHEGARGHVSPLHSGNERGLVSPRLDLPPVSAFHQWAHDYQSDSESDSDRPEPDLVQDDLASRRFRPANQTAPANFAVPLNPEVMRPFPAVTPSARRSWVTMSDASRLPSVPRECSSQRSKSMSDITLERVVRTPESTSIHPLKSHGSNAASVSLRQERIRQYQARVRESESKWQEDLNKWKTRRQSLTSDLYKKKEERDQLELDPSGTVQTGEEEQGSSSRRSLQREESDSATDETPVPSPLTPSSSSMPAPVSSSDPAPDHRDYPRANSTTEASHRTPTDHVHSPDTDPSAVPVQRAKSVEGVFSGTPQMSAALPRGFRRSEGTSRLSTGVTPRPFRSKISRKSTHARFYSMDDSDSSQQEQHQRPASFPHQGVDPLPDYKDDARTSTHAAVQGRKKEDEERGHRVDSAPSIHSFISASVLMPDKAVCTSQEDKADHRDMRVSLNQTPNGGADFGFQARWDSTGARVKSVQPGSPAQLCHLQAGDEIVALGGRRVAEMSYEQWKANMDAALREGKLLMDIRRLSLNGHPDDDTSGMPVEEETKEQLNGHHVNGLPAKTTNRSFSHNPVLTKHKENEHVLTQNQNRRLEFFKQKGGSASPIPDLQVPSIGASSTRGSWNVEEERRRQEKWQLEQEQHLQEKYRRDQERLEEAWRRDQQEAALEENRDPEKQEVPSLPSGNSMCYTPPPFLNRANSPTSVAPTQQAREPPLIQNKQVQIAAAHPNKEELDSSSRASQWPGESYGFTKLTASDRKKSKSTPSLDGSHKQDSKVGVKKKSRPSQAEQERLQILAEMRKKTPVLTDSSWIRQRSTCTIHKEPVTMSPLKRHESLDNIHSSNSAPKQFSSASQPLSGLSGIVPYRGYSGRCSLGPGAAIFATALKQSSWSQIAPISPVSDAEEACNSAQPRDRQESLRRPCSRCDRPLVKGPAMVVESLDLCFHVACFKCVSCRTELRRDAESGAQVRIRHGQLFCDTCYNRLRVRPGIPKRPQCTGAADHGKDIP
ncbi:LIM domain only protein 7b isoform X1 [Clarias gariepinus]|uniref:LIM domain only protein 7b isoform X1 n=1 Tax=Clarias gariepinus TaxID=13013 RepID=UPI00234C6337|nr:LIM domain only protein 7b isoform X1 [Clarias gariepinus]